MLDWHKGAGTMGGTCLEESLSNIPNHSLLPVWTDASARCVNVKRTFFFFLFFFFSLPNLWPAALWPRCLLPAQLHRSKSVNCTAAGAQGGKSSESRGPVCCCCRNQDILPAPRRNSRDFSPPVVVPPPLPESNLPACRAVSGGLRLTLSPWMLPKVCFGRWKTRFYHCDEYFLRFATHPVVRSFSLGRRALDLWCSLLTGTTAFRKSLRIIFSPVFTVWVGPGVHNGLILWIYAREPFPPNIVSRHHVSLIYSPSSTVDLTRVWFVLTVPSLPKIAAKLGLAHHHASLLGENLLQNWGKSRGSMTCALDFFESTFHSHIIS